MIGTQNITANYRVLTILSLLNACGMAGLLTINSLLTIAYRNQYVGQYAESLSSEQLALHFSLTMVVEMTGFAVAAIPAAIWVKRFSWRTALYLSAGSVILMNLLSTSLIGFALFPVIRFLGGFAAGMQLAVCMAVIHRNLDPDSSLGYWFGLQLLVGLVGVIFLRDFEGGLSMKIGTFFLLIAGLHALLLLFIRFIPDSGEIEQVPEVKATTSIPVLVALGFIGLYLFLAVRSGVHNWCLQKLVDSLGREDALSTYMRVREDFWPVALFAGFLGSMVTAVLSTRFNRLVPVALGMGLAIFGMALLLTDFSIDVFGISVILSHFALYFTLPYIMGCIANVDAAGRLLILSSMVAFLGSIMGSAWAAILFQTSDSHTPVLWMGIITMLLSILFVSKLALQPPRE